MAFNPLRGRGGVNKGRGGSGRGTPIKKGTGQTVTTRSTKSSVVPSVINPEEEAVQAQAQMIKWMKTMEKELKDAPSAAAMEASWTEQIDTHLISAEETVRSETRALEMVKGGPRMPSNFNIFSPLSSSDAKDDPQDVAGPSGSIPKKKKNLPVIPTPVEEESEESEDERGAVGGIEEDKMILIHEIDLGPMDLNEAQLAIMQSHIRDIIDILLAPSPQISIETDNGVFRMYKSSSGELKRLPHGSREAKRKCPTRPESKVEKPSIAYNQIFNSGRQVPEVPKNMIRVSVVMKTEKKKVVYTIPRAADGTPVTALKDYMRSKGKTDWALRNLDYGTAKIN